MTVAITPDTIVRHELIGLSVRIVEATDPTRVGITGTIVAESKQTVSIETNTDVKMIPKAGTTFEFELPNDEFVVVEGRKLVSRPARRSEHYRGNKWHSE